MYDASEAELEMARRVRNLTGKRLRTCVFCVKYARGNFAKALEVCGNEPAEDGRQSGI